LQTGNDGGAISGKDSLASNTELEIATLTLPKLAGLVRVDSGAITTWADGLALSFGPADLFEEIMYLLFGHACDACEA
jgi:hypothetical protein